jgi:hypothetical protein
LPRSLATLDEPMLPPKMTAHLKDIASAVHSKLTSKKVSGDLKVPVSRAVVCQALRNTKGPGSTPEVGEAEAAPKYLKNLKSQMFFDGKSKKLEKMGQWPLAKLSKYWKSLKFCKVVLLP